MDGIFYSVIRIFYKGATETHSVQQYSDMREAQKRFYNIVGADLADNDITYQAAYIIDSNGVVCDWKVFDRRAEEVEE